VKALLRRRSTQRGAALILMMTVVIMGLAWYTVGALGKAPRSAAEREIRTGEALAAGKRALLNYVAYRAARPDEAIPGRLPCPEPLSAGVGDEGVAAGCSNNTATYIGRLPWRTLGVEQIRDADGEPLWYILGRGFRQAPVNFGTQGMIELDAVNNAAVALVIAPGAPLNTLAEPAGPCALVNQNPRIVTAGTLDPARFLECGRSTVPAPGNEPQYSTTNTAPWTNDRVIAITAAELMDAIAGAIADRLQRDVAPALEEWRTSDSVSAWGSSFLPYASTFSNPSTNDLCGDSGQREGMAPFAPMSLSGCPRFTANISALLGLIPIGCTQSATNAQCSLLRLFGSSPFTARITASALAAGAFREPIAAADVQVSHGGSVTGFSINYSAASGNATATIDVTWPLGLGFLSTVTVTVPHLPDAAWMADSRVAWFINNDWARYTYYGVAQSATTGAFPTTCTVGTNCLIANGLAASAANDKRLVLALTGRALSTQTQPSGNLADYLESHSSGTLVYSAQTVKSTFNDRLAACPFQFPTSGVTVCN
jgi:hypothetical protein